MQENNQQNPPVTPSIPVSEPSKPKTSVMMIVTGVIFVILLLAIGFLAYQNMQLQKEIAGLKTTQNNIVYSPTPVATSDPMAGWKTYTNMDYNFTFTYPSYLSSNIGVVSGPYTGTSKTIQTFSDPSTIREGTDAAFDGFSLYVVTDTKSAGPVEYLDNELSSAQSSSYGDGDKIVLDKGFAVTTMAISPSISLHYLPTSDGKTVVVFSQIKTSDKSNFALDFDKILSNFKFTN